MSLTPDPPILNLECISQNGDPATPHTNHFELSTSLFTVPSVGSEGSVTVKDSTLYTKNMFVFILNAGFFEIINIPSATSLLVRNNGDNDNKVPGTTAPIGSNIQPHTPNPTLAAQITGQFYTNLVNTFVTPSGASPAIAAVDEVTGAFIDMVIFITAAGWYKITAIDTVSKTLTVINADLTQNETSGKNIPIGTVVYPEHFRTILIDGARLAYVPPTAFFGGTLKVLETVPRTPGLSNADILTGKETGLATAAGANDENLATVVFSPAFDNEPVVILTIRKDGALTELFHVNVRDLLSTGFDIYSSNNAAGANSIDVHWIAIGT